MPITLKQFDCFWYENLIYFHLFISLLIILPLIISIALYTLLERKILAAIHKREGPSVVGFWGLLQPFADAFKLLLKEWVIPKKAYTFVFLLCPFFNFFISLLSWAIIPLNFSNIVADLDLNLFVLLLFSSLGIYTVFLAGWASNSKYSFLGALRSCSQMLSYEIIVSLCILPVILCANSTNLTDIVYMQKGTWYCFPLLPCFLIFFVAMLAETNRAPFDLPEAEAELVAGFFVEYSGITFAMFFLGEYSNMLIMSTIMSIFFLGGWWPFFSIPLFSYEFWLILKICMIAALYIVIRGTLPRVRFDALMQNCWTYFLPLLFCYLIFFMSVLLLNDGFVSNILF